MIALVGITNAWARDFESGGLWYTVLDETQKTCKTREGTMTTAGAPSDTSFSGELKIPGKVSDGTAEYTVTEIGKYSFYGCSFRNRRIINGEIPASVKKIGESAFENCNIEYLMLPENGVEKIDKRAFYSNDRETAIKYAYLPQCVERQYKIDCLEDIVSVEYSRLIVAHYPWRCGDQDNDKRVNIIFGECEWDGVCLYSDTQYGRTLKFVSWVADGTLRVPETYTTVVGKYGGYENLSTILPRTIKYYDYGKLGVIGNMAAPAYYAYQAGTQIQTSGINGYGSIAYYSDKAEILDNCIYDDINWYSLFKDPYAGYEDNKLALIYYIPDKVMKSLIYTTNDQPQIFKIKDGTEIIISSFINTKNLKAVEIPASVRHILSSFGGIETLEECSLPAELTTVYNSFSSLPNLTDVRIPATIRYLHGFSNCGIKEIDFPDSICYLYAFDNYCGGKYETPRLERVTFGKNIKSISGFNFIAAETVEIPEGTSMIYNAFNNSPALKSITLPDGLEYVSSSFYGNASLGNITIPASVGTFLWVAGSEAYPKTMHFQSKKPPLNRIEDNPEPPAPTSEGTTCVVPDGSLEAYAEASAFHNMKLETESGLSPKRYSDGMFDYLLFADTKEAMVTGLASQPEAASIPNRIPVETESGAEFYPVTAIGEGAFEGKSGLQKIELSAALRHIGNRAFKDCSSLRDIKFPTVLERIGSCAFYNCGGLEEATFYNALDYVDVEAFSRCGSLKKVSFSDGPQKIGQAAFAYCSSLKEVQLPIRLHKINQGAFQSTGLERIDMCATLVDTIADGAFRICKSLKTVMLPKTLRKLGQSSFSLCTALEQAELPEGLRYIGSQSFMNTALKEVVIPASVEKLCLNAFMNCADIEYIKLCDSELPLIPVKEGSGSYNTNIFNNWTDLKVFEGCTPKRLYIGRPTGIYHSEIDETKEEGEDSWTDRLGAGSICDKSALESLIIGNLVTYISSSFSEIPTLTELKLGANLEFIEKYAFANIGITDLIIPSNVKEIRTSAFSGTDLKNISIGSGIERIGERVFDGADNLERINITALKSPVAYNNTFSWYGCSLYVTPGCRESYENNPNCWYRFNNFELIEADKVSINTESVEIEDGKPLQLSATITPANATLQTILWESSDPSICTVDNNGLVTFVGRQNSGAADVMEKAPAAKGSVEIRAYTLYADSPVATCKVNYTLSGIESVESDYEAEQVAIDTNMPYRIYTLDGCEMTNDVKNLPQGVYIEVQGGKSRKIIAR